MLNVLITGAASGIGESIRNYYLGKGHNVFALDVKKIDEQNGLLSFVCDITNENEINKIKKQLDEQKIRLDLIINVAGIHKMASLVENDFNEMKKVIDINLTGTMLVNKTFHSLLQKNGRIIIVTSEVASFDPMPFNGLYNISKTALDCYAQALRQELNLINQKVITIRPGAVETPLSSYSLEDTKKLSNSTKLYQKQAGKFVKIASKFMGTPIKPIKLAKIIYIASIKKNPIIIYQVHRNLGLILLNCLPKRMQCWIIRCLLGKSE